jgi:hypothetical protein
MKRWGVSVGGLQPMEGQAQATHLQCEEMPWYVYFIDEHLTSFCCWPIFYWAGKKYTFHDITIPSWPTWTDKEGYTLNPKEYWGDFGGILHVYFITPVYEWCWKRTKSWSVPVPWSLLKPHQSSHTIDWVEKSFADHIEWQKEKQSDSSDTGTDNQSSGDNTQQPEVGA